MLEDARNGQQAELAATAGRLEVARPSGQQVCQRQAPKSRDSARAERPIDSMSDAPFADSTTSSTKFDSAAEIARALKVDDERSVENVDKVENDESIERSDRDAKSERASCSDDEK